MSAPRFAAALAAPRSQALLGNAPPRSSASLALLLIAAMLCSGCATWKGLLSPQKTVAEDREARRQAAMQAFEQQRDLMQLQAAMDRFQQGDYAGCESRLATLVARRPDLLPARLRLAEILWARGETAEAEQHYLAVLSAEPANSEAHHGLGTLLEAEGRFEEAEPHLAQAAADDTATGPLMDAAVSR